MLKAHPKVNVNGMFQVGSLDAAGQGPLGREATPAFPAQQTSHSTTTPQYLVQPEYAQQLHTLDEYLVIDSSWANLESRDSLAGLYSYLLLMGGTDPTVVILSPPVLLTRPEYQQRPADNALSHSTR